MDKEVFRDAINEIYFIFGRRPPEPRHVEIFFRQVEKLPDGFMNFAIRHFEEAEKLPRNMGRYLIRELWPVYLERNPDLKSREILCCANCDPSVPGYRKVYEREQAGWGDKVWKPVLVRCACGNAPNPRNEPVYTDSELEDKGYSLTIPFHFTPEDLPEALRKIIGKKEESRPEPTATSKACEDDWF